MQKLHAKYFIGSTELNRKSVENILNDADNEVIAIFQRNKIIAYLVPAEKYEEAKE